MTQSDNENSSNSESAIIRRLIRGGGFAFLGKLITYPLGLVLTMVFARLLSTADVGGYFLAMSLIMLGSSLVQAGLATTMNKVVARSLANNDHLAARKTISIGIKALFVSSLIAVLLLTNEPGEWLLSQLDDGDYLLTGLIWIAAMIVIFAGVNYCCEILRGFHDLPSAALLDQQLLQRLVLFVVLLVPLALDRALSLVQVLQMTTAAAFLALLCGIFFVFPKIKQLGQHGDSIPAKKVLAEAPTFLLVRINTWILNSAAIWVLGFARPLEEAALYGAGNAVALLVLAAWQVVSSAIGPTVVTLHAEDRSSALESILRSAAAVAALPGLILAAILYFFGDSVLRILFTPEYAGAAGILVVLAIGRSISTLFGSPMMLLSMTHHQDIVLRVLIGASALTLAGYAWVAEPYGAIGVATVSAISVVAQAIILFIVAQRVLKLNTLPNISVSGWRNFFKRIM